MSHSTLNFEGIRTDVGHQTFLIHRHGLAQNKHARVESLRVKGVLWLRGLRAIENNFRHFYNTIQCWKMHGSAARKY